LKPVRVAAVFALAALAAPENARAQALRHSALPEPPKAGQWRVEAEASWYRPGTFVDSEGGCQYFFGAPDFLFAALRVSYSPFRRLALGIELPYRSTSVPIAEADSLTASGVPGGGVFLDWSPVESSKLRSVIRFEYLRSRSQGDDAVTISDGADRYSFEAVFLTRPALTGPDWRGDARMGFRFAPAAEGRDAFAEWTVDLRFGRRLARVGTGRLDALALAGYAISSEARQEGLVLRDRKAEGALAGMVLEAGWPAGEAANRKVTLIAGRDFAASNSLSGWRLSLTLKSDF
jgi:hypothetical protein